MHLLTTYYSLLTTYYLRLTKRDAHSLLGMRHPSGMMQGSHYYSLLLLLATCYLLLATYYLHDARISLLLTTYYLLLATYYLLLASCKDLRQTRELDSSMHGCTVSSLRLSLGLSLRLSLRRIPNRSPQSPGPTRGGAPA